MSANRKIGDGDYLLDHLGPGFTGLYFTRQKQVPESAMALFAKLAALDRYFKPLVVASNASQPGDIEVIEDRRGSLFESYAATDGSFYLIRPDLYVAARWISVASDEVEQALRTALGRNGQ